MVLRIWYAVSGTEVGYAATGGLEAHQGREQEAPTGVCVCVCVWLVVCLCVCLVVSLSLSLSLTLSACLMVCLCLSSDPHSPTPGRGSGQGVIGRQGTAKPNAIAHGFSTICTRSVLASI
eukprot:1067621-Rhodomonas_salina.1